MTRRRGELGAFVVATTLGACGTDAPLGAPLHHLRFQLNADECQAHCVDVLTAELYRDGETLPIGPPVAVPCGEAVDFPDLPAGHRVRVRASASGAGVVRLSGWSDVVTVPASGDATALVALQGVIAPVVTSVDAPVLPPNVSTLHLAGSGFDGPAGAVSVFLGDTPVSVAGAGDIGLTITLPDSADTGNTLTVEVCGIASEPTTIRALRQVPTVVTLDASVCDGAAVTGLATSAGRIVASMGCGDGGRLVEIVDGACTIGLFGAPFAARPTAVAFGSASAASEAAPVVVALADGSLIEVTATSTTPLAWPSSLGAISRLATTPLGVVGITAAGAGRVGDDGGEILVTNDLRAAIDAAGLNGGVAVLLDGSLGPALRLTRTGRATIDVNLDGCTAASGVTVGVGLVGGSAGETLVTACAEGFVLLDAESLTLTSVATPIGAGRPAVALGVAFALGDDALVAAIDTSSYRLDFSNGPSAADSVTSLASLLDGRLTFAAGPLLRLISPFRGLPTCGAP